MPFFIDKLQVYDKFSKYCGSKGLNVGYVISEMIHDWLVKEGVIKKE